MPRETTLQRRARRALERQLAYQRAKARQVRGHEAEHVEAMRVRSARVRERLERVRPLAPDARVLEVGCGAHGLVFFLGTTRGVGCDPLSYDYAALFPAWQRRVPTIAAAGERLPFADASFDVVLCDNVVDHAESPAEIARELSRVLSPGGLLYFTVNFHHAVYTFASRLHSAWNAAGLGFEIGPFADHTVHLTLDGARALPRPPAPRHKRMRRRRRRQTRRAPSPAPRGRPPQTPLLQNALYELLAERTP